jgi:hypothetical protein
MATPTKGGGVQGATKVTVSRPERDFDKQNRQREIGLTFRARERSGGGDYSDTSANVSGAPKYISSDGRVNRINSAIGIKKGGVKKRAAAITVSFLIMSWTWWLWLFVQIPLAITAVAGIGTAATGEAIWWGILDKLGITSNLGMLMFSAGTFGVLIVGIISFLIASSFFQMRGINCWKSLSVIIMALCFCGYIIPGINLMPLIWFWCIYVVYSQGD